MPTRRRTEAADDPGEWPEYEPDLPKYKPRKWRNEKTVHDDPDCHELESAKDVQTIETMEVFERTWDVTMCVECHDWKDRDQTEGDWGPQRSLREAAKSYEGPEYAKEHN